MESLSLLGSNLLSPPIVAFAAGACSIWARSDLKIPEQIYQALTIYLLIAIGFKGGVAISSAGLGSLILPMMATLFVGLLIPVVVFAVTRWFLKSSVSNAAALAAHYGSVSAVTFMACLVFLDRQSMPYESFMPAVMAVMELPALLMALLLAKRFDSNQNASMSHCIKEALSGKTFTLLLCGLLIGGLSGDSGRELMHPFLVTPFYGILVLFLLDMGQSAASHLSTAKVLGERLIAFTIAAPIVQGLLGLGLAYLIGLSQGEAIVFAILTASSSYIAAPAACRAALPEANPGIYVTASLGITFPFNLAIGVPLFYWISGLIY